MKAKKRSSSQAENGKDQNKDLKELKLHKNISYNPKR